jgi:Zn-dependent peptidase ImmA (M78 family)
MNAIVAERIRNSRILNGLSLQEVANQLGVSKQMVSKYEQGIMPNSEKLIAFSKLFNQKIDYFFRKSEVEIGEINFRKKSKFGAKRVNSLKEEIRIEIENYLYIENIFNITSVFENPLKDFPINSDEDIRNAVKKVRETWQIGTDSVHKIIDLFEDHEVKVIEIDEETTQFDGLATIIDSKYFVIVINKSMPVERKRFTLLHELGHLILDLSAFEEKQKEKKCHLFASEFLLSKEMAKVEFGDNRHNISNEELKNIQEKYGISCSAIMMKLADSGIISDEKKISFYKSLNFQPHLKSDLEMSRYKSNESSIRFENLVYRAVSEELITISKATSLLQITLDDLKNRLSINIG